MHAQDQRAQRQHQRIDRGPRQIDIGARLPAFAAPVPPGSAVAHQRVEDHDPQRAAVDECTTEVVHDVGVTI